MSFFNGEIYNKYFFYSHTTNIEYWSGFRNTHLLINTCLSILHWIFKSVPLRRKIQ